MTTDNPIDVNVFDIVTIAPTSPAAGNNFSLAVNANARWQILYVGFVLVTDATVAGRIASVHGFDGTDIIYETHPSVPQAASLAFSYHFNVGSGGAHTGGAGSLIVAPLNSQLFLRQGDSIFVLVHNIQAADQISDVRIRLKQWITEN
jgi:hypothetical protein